MQMLLCLYGSLCIVTCTLCIPSHLFNEWEKKKRDRGTWWMLFNSNSYTNAAAASNNETRLKPFRPDSTRLDSTRSDSHSARTMERLVTINSNEWRVGSNPMVSFVANHHHLTGETGNQHTHTRTPNTHTFCFNLHTNGLYTTNWHLIMIQSKSRLWSQFVSWFHCITNIDMNERKAKHVHFHFEI